MAALLWFGLAAVVCNAQGEFPRSEHLQRYYITSDGMMILHGLDIQTVPDNAFGDYPSITVRIIKRVYMWLTLWGRDKMAAFSQTTSFKCIFVNENVWTSIKISMKFVPTGLINNIPALVQIMAWRRLGDKPLSEAMMVRHIYSSLGLNELISDEENIEQFNLSLDRDWR